MDQHIYCKRYCCRGHKGKDSVKIHRSKLGNASSRSGLERIIVEGNLNCVLGMEEGASCGADHCSSCCNGHDNPQNTSKVPPPTATGGSNNEGGSFECNICLELAQDPIVTLCGHLFCWPCLYKWLYVHSQSQECPVCKALVEEDKIVPLYGRGKVGSPDPRSKSVPGVKIPSRPAGHRPETAPAPDASQFHQPPLGFMGGAPAPMATARFGNFTFSAGFGLFPSLFGFQMHGFPDAVGYGASPGFHYGFPHPFQGGHHHAFHQRMTREQQQEAMLSKYLIIIGALVIFCLLFF